MWRFLLGKETGTPTDGEILAYLKDPEVNSCDASRTVSGGQVQGSPPAEAERGICYQVPLSAPSNVTLAQVLEQDQSLSSLTGVNIN